MTGAARDALNALMREMDDMTDDERQEVFAELKEHYCAWCGSMNASACTCMRDD